MHEVDSPPAERSGEYREELDRLEHMLNDGSDDLKAGRTASRDEMRREIEAMFTEHTAKRSAPKRA